MPEHVAFRQVDQQGVLVDLQQGMYYGLNELGCRVLQLVEVAHTAHDPTNHSTVQGIVTALGAEYQDVEPSQLHRDVEAFLLHLASKGLVTWHDDTAPA
jgi:hypothetical protein